MVVSQNSCSYRHSVFKNTQVTISLWSNSFTGTIIFLSYCVHLENVARAVRSSMPKNLKFVKQKMSEINL